MLAPQKVGRREHYQKVKGNGEKKLEKYHGKVNEKSKIRGTQKRSSSFDILAEDDILEKILRSEDLPNGQENKEKESGMLNEPDKAQLKSKRKRYVVQVFEKKKSPGQHEAHICWRLIKRPVREKE